MSVPTVSAEHEPEVRPWWSVVGSLARMALLWAPLGGLAGLWLFFAVARAYDPEGDDLMPFTIAVVGFGVVVAIHAVFGALEFTVPRRRLPGIGRDFAIVLFAGIVLVDALVIGFFWMIWGIGGAGD